METVKILLKHMLAALMLIPVMTAAHSSHNPIDDIAKYDQTVTERQAEFKQSQQKKYTICKSRLAPSKAKYSP